MRSVTISVRITESQLSALKKESEFTGATINMLAKKGIDLYIELEHPVVMQGAHSKKRSRKTDTVSVR